MLTQTRNLRHALAALTLSAITFSQPHSALAQDTWTGADSPGNQNWTDPNNWQGTIAPLAGDQLLFTGSSVANNNDYTAGTAFNGISFDGGAGAFTLAGNAIQISGSMATNSYGILNLSGQHQIINLNLTLGSGYYIFADYSGLGLALNGTFTGSSNNIAQFYGSVTSSTMTTDSTGLIAGLGGTGLIYNGAYPIGTTGQPTGLATVAGGLIQPYTGYVTVNTGNAIPNGAANNIQLQTVSSSGTYTTSSTTVNTITSQQNGNSTGASTDTINNTGTLTLGNKGGIYVLNSAAASKTCFVLSGGNLTAGTVGIPATLVLATDGTTSGNQSEINAVIQDNGASGPVTIMTAGIGSQFFNKASTYTGGTIVTEGQLQASTSSSAFGTGPVTVLSGGTIRLAIGGTYANNFFLSPGLGDTTGSASIANPGSLTWDTTTTLGGKLTLLGNAATNGHGDRISGNGTGLAFTFTGQITGPGTLEFGGAHTGSYTLSNTNTNTPNNWQGGLVINANSGAINVAVKMGANNQLPSGAGFGGVSIIPASSTAVYTSLNLNGFNATINGLSSPLFASPAEVAQAMISDGDPQAASAGNSILTVGANDATATFNGISTNRGGGALSIVKIGAGAQSFGGNLYHSGNTTVSNGTMAIFGTIANSPNIIVNSGATLDATGAPGGGLIQGVNQTFTGTGAIIGTTYIYGTLAAGLMPVSGASTNIGSLTNNGPVIFNGGATNIWYVNNANAASGSSSLTVTSGQFNLSGVSAVTPMHLKLVSLTASGSPGNATFNANANQSWPLVVSSSAIQGYTGVNQFAIDTSAFGNLPGGASQFSVTTNGDGTQLILVFTATQVITSAPANQTANAGGAAVFTVTASGGQPITYQWVQQGSTVLVNGSTTGDGALVSITTNGAGTISTLTLSGVFDADAGAITVNVTNHDGASGSATASLSIIDPPNNVAITSSGATLIADGGITYLTAAPASGTAPYTYIWSFNGTVLTNATSAILAVNVSPTNAGNYTVVISNPAGSASNSFTITPVTSVPNQVIYEPFDSYGVMSGPSAPYTWQGVTNIFNQATDEGAYWFHSSGNRTSLVIEPNSMNNYTVNGGQGYPWPGLAGASSQDMYLQVSSSASDNDQLQFARNGFAPGTSVYVSFLLNCANVGTGNVSDCIAALNAANQGGGGTSFNLKISTETQPDGSYWLGLSKGNGNTGASQGVDANTAWVQGFQANQDILVVAVYQVNSGLSTNNDDTVAMWINPDRSTFGTTNLPTPTVAPSTFGGVPNSGIHTFVVHGTQLPGFRYMSDLRIGTTWAAVTPKSAPDLRLADQFVAPGSTVVLASQNAGNPVTTYQWFYNGTNGSPLSDGPATSGDGAVISGSTTGTLTITGAKAAELGVYTVVGSNTDPAPLDSGVTLTGSASARVSLLSPPLSVSFQSPNVVLSWPAVFSSFTLEQTSSLSPTNWSRIATNSYVLVGTNLTYSATPSGGSKFYQLIAP